jgi:hypothetical protein
MQRYRALFFAVAVLATLPGVVLAQGTRGTGTFGGTIQQAFTVTAMSNGVLAIAMGAFAMTPGGSSLTAPPPVAFKVRSNAGYKLMVQVGALVGMTDGMSGSGGGGLTTGNFGFGFTAQVDASGASVVGGGASPSRTDTIVTGFDVTAGWPVVTTGQSPNFTKTLHDVYGQDVQILSGARISASGDNSSPDNSLTVTIGIAAQAQYLTAGNFSGTLTFTIASSGS